MNVKKIVFVSLGASVVLVALCGAVYALTSNCRCQKPILARLRSLKPVGAFK